MATQQSDVDPVRFEMYVHRLVSISEEGRIALQKVCASPIVVQGGECMSAFYAADGTTIHTASGHLRFAAGCEDAVKAVLNIYAENPGIHDGDQFYLNDPYVASTHVYDQMIVKPIFHNEKLVAWTASMTHTADTGGILRGGSTEIFHEGVRTSGIKLVEGGVSAQGRFQHPDRAVPRSQLRRSRPEITHRRQQRLRPRLPAARWRSTASTSSMRPTAS